jgi:hypothetical protein
MPLMPAIRPVSSIKSAVANPISAPPMKPEKGVRLCMIVSALNAFSGSAAARRRAEECGVLI